jgi:hypothetical protein
VQAVDGGQVTKIEGEIARLPREEQFEVLERLQRRLRDPAEAERRERLRASVRLLEQWASEPDDHDDEWWEDFERELRENRLTFRRPEELGL